MKAESNGMKKAGDRMEGNLVRKIQYRKAFVSEKMGNMMRRRWK
jgi:hypothetical protein